MEQWMLAIIWKVLFISDMEDRLYKNRSDEYA